MLNKAGMYLFLTTKMASMTVQSACFHDVIVAQVQKKKLYCALLLLSTFLGTTPNQGHDS